jgi:protein kinase A
MSQESQSLISGLCTADRSSRLGNMAGGAAQVKAHPFFNGIDWDALSRRANPGPIIPILRYPGDTRYFDKYEDPEEDPLYTDEDYNRYEEEFRDF